MKQNKKSGKVRTGSLIINALIAVSVLALLLLLLSVYYKLNSSEDAFSTYVQSLGDYNKSPVLVFKQTDFYKYLVRGTEDPSSVHSDTLQIYLVKGRADFGFDMSQVSINKKKTSFLRRSLSVDFTSSSYFPVFADITIREDDIYEVETITGRPYTEEEAKEKASIAGVVGGSLGALMGGSIFSLFTADPISKLAGSASGALIGAGAGGISSYLLTKNYCMNYKGSQKTGTERETLLDSAKPLIAMELLGGSETVSDEKTLREWEKSLIKDFEEDLTISITSFFKQFGWKTITVNFTYPSSFASLELLPLLQEEDTSGTVHEEAVQ